MGECLKLLKILKPETRDASLPKSEEDKQISQLYKIFHSDSYNPEADANKRAALAMSKAIKQLLASPKFTTQVFRIDLQVPFYIRSGDFFTILQANQIDTLVSHHADIEHIENLDLSHEQKFQIRKYAMAQQADFQSDMGS
mmetsp:Transcript_16204/g.27417  ORF Transcript_16204/g.27417 Transcript_16204/m.27417 type:complete len:141 (+) Transcript_16204:817-1239(+)